MAVVLSSQEQAGEAAANPSPLAFHDLLCLECGASATKIVISQATRMPIHAKIVGQDPFTTICGGRLVTRGQEWVAQLEPGRIVPCYPTGASSRIHMVRLGRVAHVANGAWTGTPLCGKVPAGEKHWLPTSEVDAARLCGSCRRRHGKTKE